MLAIDPSSPFTGGAILGDRVRMQDHATDPGVFIRSMATRGHLGGLALATPEAVRLLDAVGQPWILVETVGVGQVEVEVAGKADTTVVVVNPGWGDARAGQQGRPDGDRRRLRDQQGRPAPASTETRRDLEQMLDLSDLGELASADRRRRWPPTAPGSPTLWQRGRRPTASPCREGRPAAAASRERRPREELRADRRPAPGGPGPRAVPGRRRYDELERAVLERGASTRGPPPTSCSTASAPERGRARSGSTGLDGVASARWLTSWCTSSGATTAWPWSPSTTRRSTRCPAALRQQLQETAEALAGRPARRRGRDRAASGSSPPAPTSREFGGADEAAAHRRQLPRRARRRGRHPPHGHRRRRPATPSAAGASWRWPATTGSPPSGPCSASRRSCSASSPAAAARSGSPPGRPVTGQGPDPDRPPGQGRRGAAASGWPTRSWRRRSCTSGRWPSPAELARGALAAQALAKQAIDLGLDVGLPEAPGRGARRCSSTSSAPRTARSA